MINNNISQGQKMLVEVSFIRPILIILLVLYHSFAPWCGSWDVFVGFEPNILYKMIGKISYSFMLPMFCFISGYVWAYSREILKKKETFFVLVKKKLKRLYIPCLIFSILYVCMFNRSIMLNKEGIIDILDGYAHMWFLPMLFWCFLLCYCILCIKNEVCQYCIVMMLWLVSIIELPMQLSTSFYYLLFFFLGYKIFLYSNKIAVKTSLKYVIYSWLLFLFTYVLLVAFNGYVIKIFEIDLDEKNILFNIFYNNIKTIYGIIGIFALYLTAVFYTKKNSISESIVFFGKLCFGIYIFQQFILHYLYYCTTLPMIVGNKLIPWIGFVSSLFGSYYLSKLLYNTKFGRKII